MTTRSNERKSPRCVSQTRRGLNQNQIQRADDYNTRPLEIIIPHLENVKRTGEGKFIARCPAHGDKSPSLSLKELPDASVLVHCFAGCETLTVLSAIGLQLRDLYPTPAKGFENQAQRPPAPRFTAHELLELIHFEGLVVLIAASTLSRNVPLEPTDLERVGIAVKTLESALSEVSRGYR